MDIAQTKAIAFVCKEDGRSGNDLYPCHLITPIWSLRVQPTPLEPSPSFHAPSILHLSKPEGGGNQLELRVMEGTRDHVGLLGGRCKGSLTELVLASDHAKASSSAISTIRVASIWLAEKHKSLRAFHSRQMIHDQLANFIFSPSSCGSYIDKQTVKFP